MTKKYNSPPDTELLTVKLYLHFYDKSLYQPTEKSISKLCKDELKKFTSYSNKRKKEFLLVLRFAIQQQNNNFINPLHTIERDGLPPLVPFAEKNNLYFNISHSHCVVGVSIVETNNEILLGLDIEHMKPVKNFATTDFFCNENQIKNISNKRDSHKKMMLYYHYWTQKEAYIKSQGKGIFSSNIKELEFFPSQNIVNTTLSTTEISKKHAAQDHYKTSIYCSKPHQLETRVSTINKAGIFSQTQKINPHWQTFSLRK